MGPIVCAVDFSRQSAAALRWGAGLAHRYGVPVVVVHAIDPLLAQVASTRLQMDVTGETARADLAEFARAALPDSLRTPAVTVRLVVGEPADTILDLARAETASLVVVGTQGLGGVRKLLLGSTAHRVLRRADVPLLVVPEMDPTSTELRDPTAAIARVLAATDFSPASLAAVSVAAHWARELRASMVIAHVVKPADVTERWRNYVEAIEAEHVEAAERQLREVVSGLDSHPADIAPVVAVGDPPDRIATIAVEKGAGLIVLGLARASTHPRPGAVAYGVVRLSRIPVLVIPPAV